MLVAAVDYFSWIPRQRRLSILAIKLYTHSITLHNSRFKTIELCDEYSLNDVRSTENENS